MRCATTAECHKPQSPTIAGCLTCSNPVVDSLIRTAAPRDPVTRHLQRNICKAGDDGIDVCQRPSLAADRKQSLETVSEPPPELTENCLDA